MPRLIIEHNLHGIDIDPRAVQIAALALWMRAQRTWKASNIKPTERPRVTRSNIVTAEPMPGEVDMMKEFTNSLKPRLLGQLVEVVFEKMKLAGEAGSLLKIEEEIKGAIAKAKEQWSNGPNLEQEALFPRMDIPKLKQQEIRFDLSEIKGGEFWDQVEGRIIDALNTYSKEAENGMAGRRRFFSEDAARGFAFIDLCRKRYDVVMMNPPFGKLTNTVSELIKREYKRLYIDIYACFVRRMGDLLNIGGLAGIISSRSFMVGRGMEALRPHLLGSGDTYISMLWDLGNGVLDGAMVETAAYTFGRFSSEPRNHIVFWNDMNTSKEALSKPSANRSFLRTYSFFRMLPKEQFIYEADETIARALTSSQTFEPHIGRVTKGLSTCSNERFVRCIWEVPHDGIRATWEFLSKGGEYRWWSCDLHLALKWNGDGKELAVFSEITNGNAARAKQSSAYYFKPAVCFSGRSQKGFSARWLPRGCIFDTKSPVIVPKNERDLPWIVPLLMSSQYQQLISLQSKFGSYDTSAIGRLPLPQKDLDGFNSTLDVIWEPVSSIDRGAETNQNFLIPYRDIRSLQENATSALSIVNELLNRNEMELDPSVEALASKAMESHECFALQDSRWISYVFGVAFGRWDIRYATGDRQPPELPDPFEPLPACPPGMLQNPEGLPAEPNDVPADYPLCISWPGIIVEDENHSEDIVARVREAIEVIWKERAETIEQETCEILKVKTMRDYFRKPAKFFQDHLKRYSKSRRKAPIYWPLSTTSGSYTIWIYYHRLTDQTLFTCVTDFLKPKIDDVSRDIERLQKDLVEGGTAKIRSALEQLQDFRQELIDMQNELLRVAKLPYKPNLNDGVMITAAPLWRLFRLKSWQKGLKSCWEKLKGGEYEWAHLAYSIWPDRVKEKCKTDRSIAIAHDLEHLCEVEAKKPKKKKVKRKSTG